MKAAIRAFLVVLTLTLPTLAQESEEKKEPAQQGTDYSHTSSVPEPGVLVVVGSGILALALFNRRKR